MSQRMEAYPDEVLELLSHSGIDVEGTRSAWAGRLSFNGLTVAYSVESRAGRAVAIDLTSRYSFPTRVSARGLQDWAIGTRTGIVAQSYLDGSVYLAQRIPIANPVAEDALPVAVKNGIGAFGLFQTSFMRSLGGQQVFEQPTIFPPRPSDKMVVDYLTSQDFSYLSKLWGWNYNGPFVTSLSSTWTVPVNIRGKLWKISGPGPNQAGPSAMTGFSVTGQFQARSAAVQNRLKTWTRRYKSDQVVFSPESADVQVSTSISLKEGLPLATIRKRILDFVRRAEKLPATENSVFG